ncbi:MAG: type I DNA topoisomerase, partial [Candidatus Omnitrophota bacterium]
RRILDRLVGYNLSPLLWKKISRGLSAGRVQSIAVRLVVEREREIEQFKSEEYWEMDALLKKYSSGKTFLAKLDKIAGQDPKIDNQKQADEILLNAQKEKFVVTDIQQKEKRRNPQAPYTTSKLQQDAFNRLRFTADRTMRIAQQLYEGIDLGEGGSVGLITYMRTDSVTVSKDAQEACREYIKAHFGEKFLSRYPMQYKSGKTAQQAHEAIRPALPLQEPQTVKQYLSAEQYRLYVLIWNKFVASQMQAALFEVITVFVKAGDFLFRAVGSTLKFAGFLKIFDGEENREETDKQILPPLSAGEELKLVKLDVHQHFTQPPPRFSDASLVKTLEEKGIGRPSTYVPIIRTIIVRDYVRRQKGYFFPTELGVTVNDLLTKYFPKVLDFKFTAHLEEELDAVEEGKLKWLEVIKVFYKPFIKELVVAQKQIKKESIPTDEICETCGRPMVIKWGRRGRFLSCSGFPNCRNARSITTKVPCPQPDCGGLLVERRTRYGKIFYGCAKYPKCTYTSNKLPEETESNG